MNKIKIIGFDADDTLWVNEPVYHRAEDKLKKILSNYINDCDIESEQYKTEVKNIKLFGYGVKGFTLSMIETATRLTEGRITSTEIMKIIDLGKEMLQTPIELIDDVESVLQELSGNYKLIVATKGDLLDQRKKLMASGLEKYFDHIEVMSEKDPKSYERLLTNLNIAPEQFIMIGNSMRSDVLSVLEMGSNAIHVPYKTTWKREQVDSEVMNKYDFHSVKSI
ncbi:MAG: HAD family hydrolase, partial [Rhodothermaceae bacterium]